MILTDEQSFSIIKANQTAPKWVVDARKYNKKLCALVSGEEFADELIEHIEKIESPAKAALRKKYSRNTVDFFARLFKPIENVFCSTGGVKDYKGGSHQLSDDDTAKLLDIISNIRDGKSIERYIQSQWLNNYHTDPAGVIYVTYTTNENGLDKIYPTYQSIGAVRNYEPKGQLVEWILFEPDTKSVEGSLVWTIVDDLMVRTIIQTGEDFAIIEEPTKTFEHPFGETPAIINSDITNKFGKRLSPIFEVEDIAKEYARDLSIKIIYKFLQGFPKHWRRTMFCQECKGTKKSGAGQCKSCSGTGLMGNPDVGEIMNLPLPKEGEPIMSGDDIMGFSSPDLETWAKMNEELETLEDNTFKTLWGVAPRKQIQKTATEIHYDMQPQINKLNSYANAAEWIEWKITEWVANCIDTTKPKEEDVSLIVYGRRYILEGIDTIQQKYEDAKKAGDNSIVLDGIFDELLTVKFKNDPNWLKQELKKARVEPYLHNSTAEIFQFFGAKEVARKIYFHAWWKNLPDGSEKMEVEQLQAKFATDFETYLPTLKLEAINNQPINQ